MAIDYDRKLYALLNDFYDIGLLKQLNITEEKEGELEDWWRDNGKLLKDIASSSDRVNLTTNNQEINNTVHPISSQKQDVTNTSIPFEIENNDPRFDLIRQEKNIDIEKIFWWCWRFLPEIKAKEQQDALLIPAHAVLPDCPIHSYQSTVSALTGAMYPEGDKQENPYLFLFTFSPVQEFIKASRKFLDFWSSSYLLHYLGAKVCWKIAQEYGADAVITPSLWSQEIIDALMVKEFDIKGSDLFRKSFEKYTGSDPASRFENKESNSLVTAGFPNVITALVPGKDAAKKLGETLNNCIKSEWETIADKVREDIKKEVIKFLEDSNKESRIQEIISNFPEADREACRKDIEQWKQPGCWEWNSLWDAQIDNTWETYWTAVPLGHPDKSKSISCENKESETYKKWKEAQQNIAPHRFADSFPTRAEEKAYDEFNVGTWWGALQARLGQSIQSIKNTRTWQVPTAPGERSSLSGQYTALHPRLIYQERFRNGFGVSAGSLRLFWQVMAEVYPGLFNGSEKLNAIELTKRMAWNEGEIADSLGVLTKKKKIKIESKLDSQLTHSQHKITDYEKLIRFPNLSAIASARFAKEHPEKIISYWNILNQQINANFDDELSKKFGVATRRQYQIKNADIAIESKLSPGDKKYNGVMFSSKWLADDMGLEPGQANTLRGLVDKAHKDCGFGNGSPADWWVIVLGDGDGMGKYVSGSKLKNYGDYINKSAIDNSQIDPETWDNFCDKTKKRMGPATHVGLNRALLDFSNRLVPYLTERRFCGKVVYSGGDDVMAVLPLADLPEYLLSLRSAWCGENDPQGEFESRNSGYWHPIKDKNIKGLQQRPYFTMGEGATMSLGIVIAHKSVPLPTVLESLWTAEKERAKKLTGASWTVNPPSPQNLGGNESENSNKEKEIHSIPAKDGLCFRVIYGSGNTLEALMKGHLLEPWWDFISKCQKKGINDISPLLYRLAEDLPRHAAITKNSKLLSQAAKVICDRRDEKLTDNLKTELAEWLDSWEEWAYRAKQSAKEEVLGTTEADLAKLLRFSAFWVDKMTQQQKWTEEVKS